MNYYEVALATPARWKHANLTYHFDGELELHNVVQVPFGSTYKVGYVVRAVKKPAFETKQVYAHENDKLPYLSLEFKKWLKEFYGGDDNDALNLLFPNYLKIPKKILIADTTEKQPLLELSPEQQRSYDEIKSGNASALLRGITGSGKTRIYTHLIASTLSQNKSALLLLPEILLTTQLVDVLEKHFSCIVFHSKLTNSQRSKLWFKVLRSKEPLVIIGARSSLFLPFTNIGLIIIDEAHDSSYKQESDLRYNSLFVAGGLARIHKAQLVLGSATPPVTESYFLLKNGGTLVDLPIKALGNTGDSQLQIINRNDRDLFKRHPILSNKLLDQISDTIKSGKQSIIFLNRRGTARLLACEQADWHAECPRCDLPLTYHHDTFKLLCHSCGHREKPPATCPVCHSRVKASSMGVKSVVNDLEKLFPDAKIGRYDSDNSKEEAFYSNYHAIRQGSVDIIVGTQQLTKGLDLPLLETVGIVNADLPLNFPDYTSSERQFQLIAQVAGRVNRGHGNSHIILQTNDPNNSVIHQALKEDWHSFYNSELESRRIHSFPPTVFAGKIIIREKSEKKAQMKATSIKEKITGVSILGPMPSFHSKRGSHYYYQLVLTSKNRKMLLSQLNKFGRDAIIDIDPSTLL